MSADTTPCTCRPAWPGHTCTQFTPAEQALADHLGTHGSTVLYDPEIKEAVAVVRPALLGDAAGSLRAIAEHRLATAPDALAYARAEGITEAAVLLERGLEDEGDTDGD